MKRADGSGLRVRIVRQVAGRGINKAQNRLYLFTSGEKIHNEKRICKKMIRLNGNAPKTGLKR